MAKANGHLLYRVRKSDEYITRSGGGRGRRVGRASARHERTFRDRRAFHAWLQEDAEHQLAHDRLQAVLATLRAHTELLELSALQDEARNSAHEGRVRRVASVVSIAAAAVLVLSLAVGSQTDRTGDIAALPQGDTIYATSPDEHTRVSLADGSVVTMDAGTRFTARLGHARRDITLLAGQGVELGRRTRLLRGRASRQRCR